MIVARNSGAAAQSALNVVLDIAPANEPRLLDLLRDIAGSPGDNAVLPFARLHNLHFARLVVLPMAPRKGGGVFYPLLVIATNFDGDRAEHLKDLVRIGGGGLVSLLSHCVGFPETPADDDVYRYLDEHHRKPGAFYVNTIGRTLHQVRFEARLHGALERRLDEGDLQNLSPPAVRNALVDFVAHDEELKDALTPAPTVARMPKPLFWSLAVVAGLLALVASVLLLPMTLLLVLLLRLHEIGNRAEHRRPPNAHIRALESDEDIGVHNQLSAVGSLQPGLFRRVLLRIGLFLLQLASRHLFNDGKLAEIDTIHFARWTSIDRGKRLYFFSNYDGSAASYQDDFVERVAFGLNLVFSNGSGWPRTQYLLWKGAADEQAFKAYYRQHQVPTQAWYRAEAYAGLTAVNVADNARIRAGLVGRMDAEQARDWLRLL